MLFLDNTNLSIDDISAVISFMEKVPVSDLTLNHVTIAPGGITLLADHLRATNIKLLSLEDSRLNSTEVSVLAKKLSYSNISSLTLSGIPIGDEGVTVLANNLSSNIVILELERCNITSNGCAALAKAFSRLGQRYYHILALSDNPINSSCVEVLRLFLSCFYEVSLGKGGYIGDEGIEILATALQRKSSNLKILDVSGYNISDEALFKLINALPKSNLNEFYYTDNQFHNNRNYSLLIPHLAYALNQSKISLLAWRGNEMFGLGDVGITLLANSMEQGLLNNLDYLDLSNNQITPKGLPSLARALAKTKILQLVFQRNKIGSGLQSLFGSLKSHTPYFFDFSDNNITAEDIQCSIKAINLNNIDVGGMYLSRNPIGNQGATEIIKAFGRTLNYLSLKNTSINIDGAKKIAEMLTKSHPRLWIEKLDPNKKVPSAYPATKISYLDLSGNSLGNNSVKAICEVLPDTGIRRSNFIFDTDGIDPWIIENCGVATPSDTTLPWDALTSSANSGYSYELIYPYLLLARFYIQARQSFAMIIQDQYSLFISQNNLFATEIHDSLIDAIGSAEIIEFHPPIHYSKKGITVFDASNYQGGDTLIINLDANISIKSTITVPENNQIIIGSAHTNNFIIGKQGTVIAIQQNHGNNLLIPGINNTLLLDGNSNNHILIRAELGKIKIIGLNQQDILHIIDDRSIYFDSQFICRQINSITLLQLRDTQVQLTDASCETIAEKIRFNNQTVFAAAQREVFETEQDSLFYNSIFNICEIFLNSVGKSALLSLTPKFIAEVFYQLGGFTRREASALGQQIQFELMVYLNDSPSAITASLLAGYLTSHLTHSPKIIARVSTGASIVTSVATSLWTQDVSFAWMALLTGVSLMGASLGIIAVEKAEHVAFELITQSWNKINAAKQYATGYFSFWRQEQEIIVNNAASESNRRYCLTM